MKHRTARLRHETRTRSLTVAANRVLSPAMRRILLTGPELDGFHAPGPEDHIKLTLTLPDGRVCRRHYTPRHHDAGRGELAIDFAMHEGGPATDWARGAQPGDTLELAGPRGSLIVAADFDWWLLIGDETALPAMARRVEALPAGASVTTLAAVPGPDDEQAWSSAARHDAHWLHRPEARAADAEPFLDWLGHWPRPAGDGFVWVAAEGDVTRTLRRHLLEEWHHPKEWMRTAGYWKAGASDVHETIED